MSGEGTPIAAEVDQSNLTHAADKATVIAFVNFKSGGRRVRCFIVFLCQSTSGHEVGLLLWCLSFLCL